MNFFRSLLLASLFFANMLPASAQCNDWEVLISYPDVFIRDVDRDRFGNLYVTGLFSSPDFRIGDTVIPLQGQFSMFILKFDKTMTLSWSKSIAGCETSVHPSSLRVDKDDNIVIAGYFFCPTIAFDCIELSNHGRSEMFLVKYGKHGNVIWAKGSENISDGWDAQIVISKTNTIILSSIFLSGTVSFGGKVFHGYGGFDSFVASIGSDGDVNWIRDIGGPGSLSYDYLSNMDLDSEDNIAITGWFGSPSIQIGEINVAGNTISENLFVAKLDKSGHVIWASGGETPVNQSGWGVAVDSDDNIVVAGRFYENDITFGGITLPFVSDISYDSDIFLVKYNPDGIVINARAIGGSGFDSPYGLDLDRNGDLVMGAYYYSNSLSIDSYTTTKSEQTSDALIAILESDLSAKCVNVISGAAENIVVKLSIDPANNIWAVVDDALIDGETRFGDTYTVSDPALVSMLVSIGNNSSFDEDEPDNTVFTIDLGDDILKCPDETIQLDAGVYCGGTYVWNDGSTGSQLLARAEGWYWAEVVFNGKRDRDSVYVSFPPDPAVDLGPDRLVCPGTPHFLDATQGFPVSYEWQDGSTLSQRIVTDAGHFRVVITGECKTVEDAIILTPPPEFAVDLGPDKTLCGGETHLLSAPVEAGLSYLWEDGSTGPEFTATTSGTYSVQVSNGCETKVDEIAITFLNPNETIIPNVITPDGDPNNETFVLPEPMLGSSLKIMNRWGRPVYDSDSYQNTWSADGLEGGVYFLVIEGDCLDSPYKGYVHVIK